MTIDRAHLYAVIEDLAGPTNAAGDRAAAVLHAQIAALAWVRDTIGAYPVPAPIAAAITTAAEQLRSDQRDPIDVLTRVALDAVARHRTTAAA
ncbi:hypothetical protein ONA70_26745 [Micromonospora yasonensis]|uniref:hypothetical protein n=1 Tax=Micromonospora yasonensis TaxID=1128667 RepID=UPI002232405A|nr:hypothetical protein [Micromonospora yasonensis]MCW3843706.1 hypothetical protein [Micromonospora yasonensis]